MKTLRAHIEEVIEQLGSQHRIVGGIETAWRQLDVGQPDLGEEGIEVPLGRFGRIVFLKISGAVLRSRVAPTAGAPFTKS
jgi:hypothetical protein